MRKSKKILMQFDKDVKELEEKMKGQVLTNSEIEDYIEELGIQTDLEGIKFIEAIDERSDGLRVEFGNEILPDLVIGYDYVGENEECLITAKIKFIDVYFESDYE